MKYRIIDVWEDAPQTLAQFDQEEEATEYFNNCVTVLLDRGYRQIHSGKTTDMRYAKLIKSGHAGAGRMLILLNQDTPTGSMHISRK